MGVPQNGWFPKDNPIKMDDDWGYHQFRKPPYIHIYIYIYIYLYIYTHTSIHCNIYTFHIYIYTSIHCNIYTFHIYIYTWDLWDYMAYWSIGHFLSGMHM